MLAIWIATNPPATRANRRQSSLEMQVAGVQPDWDLIPADHAGTTVRMTQDRHLIIRNTYKHMPRGLDLPSHAKCEKPGFSFRRDHRQLGNPRSLDRRHGPGHFAIIHPVVRLQLHAHVGIFRFGRL